MHIALLTAVAICLLKPSLATSARYSRVSRGGHYQSDMIMDVFRSHLSGIITFRGLPTMEAVMLVRFRTRYSRDELPVGGLFSFNGNFNSSIRRCLSLLPGMTPSLSNEFTINANQNGGIDVNLTAAKWFSLHHEQSLPTPDESGKPDYVNCRFVGLPQDLPMWRDVVYPARFIHGLYYFSKGDRSEVRLSIDIQLGPGFITVYFNDRDIRPDYRRRYDSAEKFMKARFSLGGLNEEGMHVLIVDEGPLRKFEKDINADTGTLELFHDPLYKWESRSGEHYDREGAAVVLRFKRASQREKLEFGAKYYSELPARLRLPQEEVPPMQFGTFKRSEGIVHAGLMHEMEVTIFGNGILIEDLAHLSYAEHNRKSNPAEIDIQAFIRFAEPPRYHKVSGLYWLPLNQEDAEKVYSTVAPNDGGFNVWLKGTKTGNLELLVQFGKEWPAMSLRLVGKDTKPLFSPMEIEEREWLEESPVPVGTYGWISDGEAMCISITPTEMGVSYSSARSPALKVVGRYEVREQRLYDDRYVFDFEGSEYMSTWEPFAGRANLMGYLWHKDAAWQQTEWLMNAQGKRRFFQLEYLHEAPSTCDTDAWLAQFSQLRKGLAASTDHQKKKWIVPVLKETPLSLSWKIPVDLMRKMASKAKGVWGDSPYANIPLFIGDSEKKPELLEKSAKIRARNAKIRARNAKLGRKKRPEKDPMRYFVDRTDHSMDPKL